MSTPKDAMGHAAASKSAKHSTQKSVAAPYKRAALSLASLSLFSPFSVLSLAEPASDKVDPELRAALKQSISQADSFVDRFDAEVWLVAMAAPLSRYIKTPAEQFKMLRMVHREATRQKLQPGLVLAVIQIESAFDRFAISSAGALGLMQVMPFWKKEIGREDDNLINADTNLRYGCTILRYYLDKEQGRWAEALARYNGSYGKYWYPEKVLTAWTKYWR